MEPYEVIVARAEANAEADAHLLTELIALRRRHGLTQEVVAERMGVSQAAVSQFEKYDANPLLSTIRRYAVAVGAKVSHQVADDAFVTLASPPPFHVVRTKTPSPWGSSPFRVAHA